jgi:hypothetical protein
MQFSREKRIIATVLGAVLLLVLGATGTAVADRLIGSKDIRNNSVRSADVRNGTLKMKDLRPSVVSEINKPGPAGPPGQALVANVLTPPNDQLFNLNVVAVDDVAANSGAPDANTGATLVSVSLPAGKYLVQATAQFFDFDGGTGGADYGVTRVFLGNTEVPVSASWTPAIPADGNNAAQSSGSIIVTVPAGGATLSAKAVIRGDEPGQAGASMIVTRLG